MSFSRTFQLCLTFVLAAFGAGAVRAQAQAQPEGLPALEQLDRRLAIMEVARPLDPQNTALFAFKLEQARLWQVALKRLSGWEPPEYVAAYASTLDRASAVRHGIGDMAPVAGSNFHERAYIAINDNSAQPYWVAVPPGYSPRKKYPLLVFLHGYTPDISKINPWIPSLEMIQAAQKRGFIMAIPYGRRNTDFVQVGQDDLLAVRAEVERLYNIDDSRVHLIGASMGGYGTWAAGLHTAGQWTALAPICGRTDFYLWFRLEREAVPAWKRLLYDADDPRFLATNARNFPVLMQHGARDFVVSPEHSRRMAADARRLKLPITYLEYPEGDHYNSFQTEAFERGVQWLAQQRKPAPPQRVSLVTGDLKEARAHWARVETLIKYGRAGRLDVEIKDGHKLLVRTENVGRFVLEPPAGLLKRGQLLTLVVDGVEVEKRFDAALPVSWQATESGTGKFPARCGPFKNAFRDPFLLVYGDQTDQVSAERFRLEWWNYADGWPAIKAATSVTEADKAAYNLVLFGTGSSNALLRTISPQLPLELTATGYRIGERQVAMPGVGLRMVWKSPWSAQKLIVVQSGLWWGDRLPPNHLWDLLPDFLIYGEAIDPTDDTQVAVEAGYFDGDWRLPSAEEAAEQTAVTKAIVPRNSPQWPAFPFGLLSPDPAMLPAPAPQTPSAWGPEWETAK